MKLTHLTPIEMSTIDIRDLYADQLPYQNKCFYFKASWFRYIEVYSLKSNQLIGQLKDDFAPFKPGEYTMFVNFMPAFSPLAKYYKSFWPTNDELPTIQSLAAGIEDLVREYLDNFI